MANTQGRVISAHGRHFLVQDFNSDKILHCYPKGKKAGATVGDIVEISLSGDKQAVITNIVERKNLFYRSDINRSKQFAANIDQILFVIAVEPEFSNDLLGRALVAANNANIEIIIILNKADLPNLANAQNKLKDVVKLGIKIITLSALDKEQTTKLLGPIIQNKCSLLLGQSGMGKSTILNTLVPNAMAATNEYSSALGAGRHTTTHTRMYELKNHGYLIDSPGFQAFGLQHLSDGDLQASFPEFADYIENCRFYNCRHLQEPGCGITQAIADGKISDERYQLYKRILAENNANKRY